jgi:hypothetical protein
MEISHLVMQFMQNHDRVLPETIEKGRSGVEIRVTLTKAVKFVITVGD